MCKINAEVNSLVEILSDPKIRTVFSPGPLHHVHSENQINNNFKPKGLWYGFGASWYNWVESEMPELFHSYQFLYQIKLNKSRIKKLNNLEDINNFRNMYGESIFQGDYFQIRWENVSKKYDGIEIVNYKRYVSRDYWYCCWDVSSGCVWNYNAVEKIDLIAVKEDGKWQAK